MEDYTYHFDNGNDLVLGSHMLEVCPTIATEMCIRDSHKALPFIDTTYSSWRYFCILEYMQKYFKL